ncbi:MAG: SRPBCC domain-containing protein [Marinoscillum sp.]
MSHTIYHNFVIEKTPAEVFDAVSSPDLLINWWPLSCSGSPEIGTVYNFFFGEPYDWYGKVVASTPGESFHIKMTKADPDWDPTTFGFDLTPRDKGTNVAFWHKDWPTDNDHYKHSSFCWALLLHGLKEYLEKGKVIPFEERA